MDIPQVISCSEAETGEMGQKYLAAGKCIALRQWEESAGETMDQPTMREYETVGYVLKGEMELDLNGQIAHLSAGDSWLVPAGAPHRYTITQDLVAIEATSPPARFNHLDVPVD